MEDLIELSRGPEEFLNCFKDAGTSNLASLMLTGPPNQLAAIHHSAKSLSCGRSLGSAVIYLFGETRSGKSSTINGLFGELYCDPSVNDPVSIKSTKHVTFTPKIPAIPLRGHLSILEIPCMFETSNKNQVHNMATIQNHVRYLPELSPREDFKEAIEPYTSQIKVRGQVFPNAVLVFVRATSNRLGEDSRFKKQFEFLQLVPNLIDKENPNLIVVITNCMAWGAKVDSFQRKLDEFTILINDMTKAILGIYGLIVPVENDPEDYDLPKLDGNCYQLPNTDVTPTKLQKALLKLFKRNEDHIGEQIISEAYQTKGETPGDVERVSLSFDGAQHEVQQAYEWLINHNIPVTFHFNADNFHFKKLGFGFCPVTERAKGMVMAMSEDHENRKQVVIENKKILVPQFVSHIPSQNTQVYHSFLNKTGYDNHIKRLYEIDPSTRFAVQPHATSEGWIQPVFDEGSNLSTATLTTFTQTFYLATLRISDPVVRITNTEFQNDLSQLPESYAVETAVNFKSFLDKWGTHLVQEVKVGGVITLTYKIPKDISNQTQLQSYQQMVAPVVVNLFKSNSTQLSLHSELHNRGVTLRNVEVHGGNPRDLQEKDAEITGEKLQAWMHSISSCPVELKQSLKLCPHYDMLGPGPKRESLRRAVKQYLQEESDFEQINVGALSSRQDGNYWSNLLKELPRCFPAGTLVALEGKREMEEIENLSHNTRNLLTCDIENEPLLTHTEFCTYLHNCPEQQAQYLVFRFSNGKKLIVSEGHLIFEFLSSDQRRLYAKQARFFKPGEMMLFRGTNGVLETPQITDISRELHRGIFCPLTTSGKFFADGFLVSSYAHVTSFELADAVMTPLKLWSQFKNYSLRLREKLLLDLNQKIQISDYPASSTDSIHAFGKLLMKFPMSKKYLTN